MKNLLKKYMLLSAIALLNACTSAQPSPTANLSPTKTLLPPTATITPTPEPSATNTPKTTPTLDPLGDLDGDGYRTSFEEAWGTDPQAFTDFQELKDINQTISFVLHVREPYNIEDMNSTIHQQVNFIREELIYDSGYYDEGPFNTLTVDVVLFPYVTKIVNLYVNSLGFPYDFPLDLEAFTHPTITSDTCYEEKEMMEAIIVRSNTVFRLAELISNWNIENLDLSEEWLATYALRGLSKISTCEMMKNGWEAHSTTRANKSVSDFREAGIPSGVAFSINGTEINKETHLQHLSHHAYRASNHRQTVVWTPRYGFVIFDPYFSFKGARQTDYTGLVITEIAPDYTDFYAELWFNSDDGPFIPRGYPQPDWLHFIEDLKAPEELMKYLLPGDW